MKKLPEIEYSWKNLYDLTTAGIYGKVLNIGIKLKLFDYLNEPMDAKTLASKLGLHTRNTELLLNILAGMEIIIKDKGKFQNTKHTKQYLNSNSNLYVGGFLLHISEWFTPSEKHLIDLVKKGPPKERTDMADPEIWKNSAEMSAPYQYCGEVQNVTDIIKDFSEFPKIKKMLDLGGGAGFYTIALVSAHSDMTGVIIEQPGVADVAKKFVKEYGLQDRIKVIQGDYTNDSFEDTYDLIFASATLNFHKNHMAELFKKIFNSLNPNGIFVTNQDGITNERTKPLGMLSGFLTTEMAGGNFAILKGEINNAMKNAGFEFVHSFTRESVSGQMEITVGKKCKYNISSKQKGEK